MDRPSSLSFKAGEIVYNIDTNSNEAYIITEGDENLFSRDGFLQLPNLMEKCLEKHRL